ncbi:hypothetical protein FA95DRAFT_1613827 [Auriscalpium vulgare]|uniref:Uncharacterized protein n=1 Tax=Auriscalpium vulgare TaxID=40419 RepID=A0ACB8R1V4_9AGAM|nr:hypothetical protein FA95DRAFT_1613827 [Auriscalpium vulgare]
MSGNSTRFPIVDDDIPLPPEGIKRYLDRAVIPRAIGKSNACTVVHGRHITTIIDNGHEFGILLEHHQLCHFLDIMVTHHLRGVVPHDLQPPIILSYVKAKIAHFRQNDGVEGIYMRANIQEQCNKLRHVHYADSMGLEKSITDAVMRPPPFYSQYLALSWEGYDTIFEELNPPPGAPLVWQQYICAVVMGAFAKMAKQGPKHPHTHPTYRISMDNGLDGGFVIEDVVVLAVLVKEEFWYPILGIAQPDPQFSRITTGSLPLLLRFR